jgi:hypothetical protein
VVPLEILAIRKLRGKSNLKEVEGARGRGAEGNFLTWREGALPQTAVKEEWEFLFLVMKVLFFFGWVGI